MNLVIRQSLSESWTPLQAAVIGLGGELGSLGEVRGGVGVVPSWGTWMSGLSLPEVGW